MGEQEGIEGDVHGTDVQWNSMDKRVFFGLMVPGLFAIQGGVFPLVLAQTRQMSRGKHARLPFTDILRDQYRGGGLRGVYRGFTWSALGLMRLPVSLTAIEKLRSLGWHPSAAALLASTVARTAFCPVDLLATRLMTSDAPVTWRPIWRRMVTRREYFRGLGPLLVMGGPVAAVGWGVYLPVREWTLRLVRPHHRLLPHDASLWHPIDMVCDYLRCYHVSAIVGGFASGVAVGVGFTPVETVKSLVMVREHGSQGTWAVMKQLYRNHGVAGFFRGIVPRTLSSAIQSTIMFTAYDGLKWLALSSQHRAPAAAAAHK